MRPPGYDFKGKAAWLCILAVACGVYWVLDRWEWI